MQNRINETVETDHDWRVLAMPHGGQERRIPRLFSCIRGCLLFSCTLLCADVFHLNFVIFTNALQVFVGGIRNDNIDISWLTNPGKINEAHLAPVQRDYDLLGALDDSGFKLCFVIIRYGNRLVCDPTDSNECSGNRKLIDDLQGKRSRNASALSAQLPSEQDVGYSASVR